MTSVGGRAAFMLRDGPGSLQTPGGFAKLILSSCPKTVRFPRDTNGEETGKHHAAAAAIFAQSAGVPCVRSSLRPPSSAIARRANTLPFGYATAVDGAPRPRSRPWTGRRRRLCTSVPASRYASRRWNPISAAAAAAAAASSVAPDASCHPHVRQTCAHVVATRLLVFGYSFRLSARLRDENAFARYLGRFLFFKLD